MPTRALIAVLVLPLVFAALPLVSLFIGDSPQGLDAGELAFTTDRNLMGAAVVVSNAPGGDMPEVLDSSQAARFEQESKVMASDSDCPQDYSTQS